MRTVQRVLLGAALPAALLWMTGCSASPHSPTEKYILVAANTKLPYWQTAIAGLNDAAAEMRVKAEMAGPDSYDTKAEHDEFERAVAEKPSGIMVSPADSTLMTPDIDAALAQGVPVITVDSDAPSSKRLFFVGTDNYKAGTLGGQLTSKLLNGKGTVIVFTLPTQTNMKDRLHGYQDVFADHPDIKISQTIEVKGADHSAFAYDTVKQMLDSKSKVDAIVCLESKSCAGAADAVSRDNMTGKIVVVAMDTDPETTEWIQRGVISGTVAQKPFTMAYYGTKLLDDVHHHTPTPLTKNWAQFATSPIPTFVDTGSFVVDKSNVDTFIQQNKSATSGQ